MTTTITPNKLTDLWDKYNQVRVSGDKKTANKLLAKYIDLLKKEDARTIRIFVDEICSLILDADNQILFNNGADVSNKEIRIQHPLFKEIIVPVLAEEYKNDSPKHIKWIGQLEQFFHSDKSTTIKFLEDLNIGNIGGYFNTIHFLEKSFFLEKNQNVLNLLLDKIAQSINYYTHEVPSCVVVDPEVLDKELLFFRKYWQQSETRSIWEVKLIEWEKIAKHWTLYLTLKDRYNNFEDYLDKNGVRLN